MALDNPNYVLPANTTTEYTIWTDSYKVVGDLIPNSVKIAVSEAVSEAVSDIASELSSALESALENAFNSFMDQLKGKLSKVLG